METPDGKDRRVPFQITFLTADRPAWELKKRFMRELELIKAGTPEHDQLNAKIKALDVGGKLIDHGNCILSGFRGIHAKKDKAEKESQVSIRKNPHLWQHRMRNIVFLPSDQIRKARISLIFRFNNEQVIY